MNALAVNRHRYADRARVQRWQRFTGLTITDSFFIVELRVTPDMGRERQRRIRGLTGGPKWAARPI
jgi:hypothetical protein